MIFPNIDFWGKYSNVKIDTTFESFVSLSHWLRPHEM